MLRTAAEQFVHPAAGAHTLTRRRHLAGAVKVQLHTYLICVHCSDVCVDLSIIQSINCMNVQLVIHTYTHLSYVYSDRILCDT